MAQKSLPGPMSTSCLTCKRRHKKCDQRRPTCARCEKGDFECLGYSHHQSKVRPLSPRLSTSKPRSILPRTNQVNEPSQSITCQKVVIHERARSINEQADTENTSSTKYIINAASTPTIPSSQSSEQEAPYSMVQCARTAVTQLFMAFSRIPHSPSNPTMAFLSSSQFEDYIFTHINRAMSYVYFQPTKNQKTRFFAAIVSRFRSSWVTRWAALLDARIYESMLNDTPQPQLYNRWVSDLEVVVRTTLARDPSSPKAPNVRGDWLEVLIMKALVVPSSEVVQVLRNATPIFLQNVYCYPELWSSNSDPTSIPLLGIATSSHHELSCFALVDCVCAMVFGVPQQIEYDTTTGSLLDRTFPQVWAHSTPTEFWILLAEISACRDKRPVARDWRDIEHQLVTWTPRPTQHDDTWESWMAVAWLAVQESWRLTLLTYLYLAVCGASSDEPRIQSCVSQILQIISTIRKHDSPNVNIPFFTQYLMAGMCAKGEKHRKIVWDKLSNKSETKFWQIRSSDFAPVLDHLWHGAGANGHPIKWCDYIHSREALIPLVI